MIENVKVKLYCKTSKLNKRGEAAIYIEVRLFGKAKLYSTSKFIFPKDFDNNKGTVKSTYKLSTQLNSFLRAKISKMDEVILEIQNSNIPLTFEAISQRFKYPDIKFYDYAFSQLGKQALAKKTSETDLYHLNVIKKFKSGLQFHHITISLLKEFEGYSQKLGHSKNTIYGHMKTFRKYFYLAMADGLVKANPFEHIKIQGEEVSIDYLSIDEVNKLYELYSNTRISLRLKKTLNYYLFSCFTGLRPSDLRSLKGNHIKDGIITKKLNKTSIWVRIPLPKKAKSLINLDSEELFVGDLKKKENRLTEDLRILFEMAGIKKDKTNFYTSRHTYAVNSRVIGIDLQVLSVLMGHKSIRMTERYAKVAESLKKQEVQKWDVFYEKVKDVQAWKD